MMIVFAFLFPLLSSFNCSLIAMDLNTQKQTIERLVFFTEHGLKKKAQESKETDEIHYFFSNTEQHLSNCVTHTNFLSDDNTESVITDLCKKKKPMVWWVTPLSKPENLERLLQKHGFDPYPLTAMECCLQNVTEETLDKIMNVQSPNTISISKNKIDDADQYQLLCDNTLASCCSYIILDTWAALYSLSTQGDMRNQGFATKLIATILKDLKKQKCTAAYMIAMPITVRIGNKLGFKEMGIINYYHKLKFEAS